MVTIFKNFTTIAISMGDKVVFGQEIPSGVGMSLAIMVNSDFFCKITATWSSHCSLLGAWLRDWMIWNTMAMGIYGWLQIVYHKRAMLYDFLSKYQEYKPHKRWFCIQLYIKKAMSDTQLDHVGAAFYNNVLSIPLVAAVVWADNGFADLYSLYIPLLSTVQLKSLTHSPQWG